MDGYYEFSKLSPGVYTIFVDPPDWSSAGMTHINNIAVYDGKITTRTFILNEGATLAGLVTVEGVPLSTEAAKVDLYWTSNDRDVCESTGINGPWQSSGTYAFYNLEASTFAYYVRATRTGINKAGEVKPVSISTTVPNAQDFYLLSAVSAISGTITNNTELPPETMYYMYAIDPSSIPVYRSGVLAWPLQGAINQRYGPTSQTGFINDAYNFHNGIDIDANIGDPIKSAGDGVVKAIGNDGKYAYGKWVAIDHQNGLITLYGHFSGYAVSVGQKVKAGQVIGYAGNTGFSTGPHLHFTVYAANTFSVQDKWYGLLPLGGSINPMNYL
ncbi:MAG: hypothetical protein CO159_00510 [Candidatus Portnoybacteria bacterium CG_4_9_14_3_um_filter_40_10]|uniref:M23ase beta-sheet core domain-containing protein n=1 Tax=Candidatus Portnoybacteria bacterium CG_4_9_14_3_um_filter_40_10 TaxID=1974804 RepID=A0A2M7YPK4_9BACT|nr:MAG: hypothetical protein CO159_00510 [Candidatus Portnoybacteria bacterium CG_4_9_14_3_um_filter_40_10]